MNGLDFTQFQESSERLKTESTIIYPPAKIGDTLIVTLLGDPVNQVASAVQLEAGHEPGLFAYRWSAFQEPAVTAQAPEFTNAKGIKTKPKSTPSLFALHSVDDNGYPLRAEKRDKDINNALVYEVHKDCGMFLKKNPAFWPSYYQQSFKDQWGVKVVAIARVFVHGDDGNPIEDEKIMVISGALATEFARQLNTARELGIPNYAMRRAVFKKQMDGLRSKATVTLSQGARLDEVPLYTHLSGYQFKHSLTVGDDRVFNIDSFDLQREYLMNNYDIVLPSVEDVLEGVKSGKYKA